MGESANQNEKCKECYLLEGCMLIAVMSMIQMCGGPWKDEVERTNFIQEEILGIKKEKVGNSDTKGNQKAIRNTSHSKPLHGTRGKSI